jgi:hypothetical protein
LWSSCIESRRRSRPAWQQHLMIYQRVESAKSLIPYWLSPATICRVRTVSAIRAHGGRWMHVAHLGLSTTPNHAEATVRPFNRLRSPVRRIVSPPNSGQNVNDINGRCVTVHRDLSFDPSFLSSQGARMTSASTIPPGDSRLPRRMPRPQKTGGGVPVPPPSPAPRVRLILPF